MSDSRYMSAAEAAETLNISKATLYAYVSRGLIRSESVNDSRRERRYYREDIDTLLNRRLARENPEKVAGDALQWGTPVLQSALTLIEGGNLYYRGQSAITLAQQNSIEEVAALLWTGDLKNADSLFAVDIETDIQRYETMLLHLEIDGVQLSPIQQLQLLLPLVAADDLSAYDLRPEVIARKAARLLKLMASISAGDVPDELSLTETLQHGYCPEHPEAIPLLQQALILCADHELNASSFTARVVASAASTPYAVIMAGLAALQGTRHGGHTGRVEALFDEVGTPERAVDVVAGRLQRGDDISGFGHKLYPDGDPRGTALIQATLAQYPDAEAVQVAQAILEASDSLLNEKPTIDFALVLLTRTLKLAPGTALALFALGRSAGWIGHAIEQYTDGHLIRPRARYTGSPPVV